MRFTPIESHEVYRVSRRTRTCSKNHFEELLRLCSILPIGYAEFLAEFGIGFLDDIQILDLPDVLVYSNSFRESLKEWFALCYDSGVENGILFLFEFEEDYHLEVKQLLEKIAGRGVCGER